MAAGALGAVTALLVYSLFFNFLSPINFSFLRIILITMAFIIQHIQENIC